MVFLDDKHGSEYSVESAEVTFGGGATLPILEERLNACSSAFRQWEISWHHTDQQLYRAIGQLYALTLSLHRDMTLLIPVARARGIQVTKASTVYTLTAKLIFADDRQKASKYAGTVRFLEARNVDPNPDTVAAYITAEGGIEACLRALRIANRPGLPEVPAGEQMVFRKVSECLSAYSGCVPPDDLRLEAVEGRYFLLIDRAIGRLAKSIGTADAPHGRARRPVARDLTVVAA